MENLKQKILIVDDEQEIRIMIERFLRKEGFFAFILLLTALLLCHFAVDNPDIVILDVMLPDGDGFSLLSSIRSFRAHRFFFSLRGRG